MNNLKKNGNEYNLEERLSKLLKNHIIFKYTKSNKLSYDELLNYTINLEIENNGLSQIIESQKLTCFKLEQKIIDLEIILNQNHIMINSLNNKLKFKILPIQAKTTKTNKFDILETSKEVSISNSSIEVDSHLMESIKKKKKSDRKFQEDAELTLQENEKLLKDISAYTEEIHNLRTTIEEKDKIISILYQEVENLKQEEKFTENSPYSLSDIPDNTHLENLNFIKKLLLDFLKNYGIGQDFSYSLSENQENLSLIELRMKEIEYIIVNLKKINIIFKSLIMDYTNNLLNSIESEMLKTFNDKFSIFSQKFQKISELLKIKFKIF
jgi:hypothetical protein